MSLPLLQNTTQPSNSPSKSSLRRTSGKGGSSSRATSGNSPNPGPTTHFASEATQHHFLPQSPPNQTLEYEEEDESAVIYDDSSYRTAPQPHIPFQPFFTLIEDTVTNEHYHPTIHYLFADDDPDIITEAACRSISENADSPSVASTAEQVDTQAHERAFELEESESRLPPRRSGVRDHYLVLDVHPAVSSTHPSSQHQLPDGLPSPSPSSIETAHRLTRAYPYTVTSVQSLSADWQIIRTNIADAPTMNSEQQHSNEQHLMLRIEGRGNSPDKLLSRREDETTENMVERFQTRLAELRTLMVELDVGNEGEGDIFLQDGLVGQNYPPSGFGTAVLDEQD